MTTHLQFLSSEDREAIVFRKACELAGIAPSRRQASKWRRREGAAWKKVRAAERELAAEKGGSDE